MKNIGIIRRQKLGRSTCEGIAKHMNDLGRDYKVITYCHGKDHPDTLKGCDVIFRWGCTANVPRVLPDGKRNVVVNHAKAIHTVADKREFRKALNENELCPKTWFNLEQLYDYFIQNGFKDVIVRGANHARGKQLDFCTDINSIIDAVDKYPEGYYINEYIPKVAEYRVFVAHGRVVCVTNKTPKDKEAIAWNRAVDHGDYDNVKWGQWPLEVCRVACDAARLAGITYTGVDVIVDKDGRAYVVEANAAPTCSPYRQQCMARVFNWMIQNEHYNTMLNVGNGMEWRELIHPAISDEAHVYH